MNNGAMIINIEQAIGHIGRCITMFERYSPTPHNLAVLEGLRSERNELAAYLDDNSISLSYAAARNLETVPAWGYEGT